MKVNKSLKYICEVKKKNKKNYAKICLYQKIVLISRNKYVSSTIFPIRFPNKYSNAYVRSPDYSIIRRPLMFFYYKFHCT